MNNKVDEKSSFRKHLFLNLNMIFPSMPNEIERFDRKCFVLNSFYYYCLHKQNVTDDGVKYQNCRSVFQFWESRCDRHYLIFTPYTLAYVVDKCAILIRLKKNFCNTHSTRDSTRESVF